MEDKWSRVFHNFFTIHDVSHCETVRVVGLGILKSFSGLDFAKKDHRFLEIEIQRCEFFFANISKSMRNQRLRFYHIVVLGLLNMINGFDLSCGIEKLGFQIQNR